MSFVVCLVLFLICQKNHKKSQKIAKKKYLHTDERDSQHRSWPGDPKTSEYARYGDPIVLICYLYLMNTIRPPCADIAFQHCQVADKEADGLENGRRN